MPNQAEKLGLSTISLAKSRYNYASDSGKRGFPKAL